MMTAYERGDVTHLEPFGGRTEVSGVLFLNPVVLFLLDSPASAGASAQYVVPLCHTGAWIWGTDFDFIFNELIHETKVLSLIVNSRACLLLVILLLL